MPKPIRMPDLGPRPEVRTSAGWGRRARALNGDSVMLRVTHRHWARGPGPLTVPLEPLQRAALLQPVLDSPESRVRVTGLSALELYGLPIGKPDPAIDEVLGHPPPARAREYAKMLATPHFSWSETRVRTPLDHVRVSKSYGLDRYPGQWGSWLADPVEALVVASPYLPRWRITACLDALMSRNIQSVQGERFPLYSRNLINKRLLHFPPNSPSVRRTRAALEDAVENTWSPRETLTRLIVLAHGFPEPVINFHVVLDQADRYLDLAWPESRVAVEYNGADHADRREYGDELFRKQRLEDNGWKIRFVVLEDLVDPQRRQLWLSWLANELANAKLPGQFHDIFKPPRRSEAV